MTHSLQLASELIESLHGLETEEMHLIESIADNQAAMDRHKAAVVHEGTPGGNAEQRAASQRMILEDEFSLPASVWALELGPELLEPAKQYRAARRERDSAQQLLGRVRVDIAYARRRLNLTLTVLQRPTLPSLELVVGAGGNSDQGVHS